MFRRLESVAQHLFQAARTALFGPQLFAFLPASTLFVYWFGGEAALAVGHADHAGKDQQSCHLSSVHVLVWFGLIVVSVCVSVKSDSVGVPST